MLLIALVSPDSSIIGINSTNVYSIACCIVSENAESARPMPTEAVVNRNRPAYNVISDPVGGTSDGLLKKCQDTSTCPKIMQVDGSFEWWGGRASLVVTDGQAHDLTLPTNGSQIAAANFDETGTTKLGTKLVDHSFIIPVIILGLTTAISGLIIGGIFY